jgi:hypothetical protein
MDGLAAISGVLVVLIPRRPRRRLGVNPRTLCGQLPRPDEPCKRSMGENR